jgi:hypothetical protein
VFTGSVAGTTAPSAYLNSILLAGDAGDANMSIMHNNGAGAATKIALGAGFPNHTTDANLYELILDFYGDGVARFCYYTARNMVTNEEVRGEITGSELPVEGTALGFGIARSNHADSGTAIQIDYGGFFAGSYA